MNSLQVFIDSLLDNTIATVLKSGRNFKDVTQFIEVFKSEIKDFFYGSSYKDERDVVKAGILSDKYIISTLISNIISKTELV